MFPALLRDKLLQVQEELTSSLRTLVLAEPTSLVKTSKHENDLKNVPLDAGADLLNHYQYSWCRIREASERNFKIAENADKTIHIIANYVMKQHSNLDCLNKHLSSMSQLTEQLERLKLSLETLQKQFTDVEKQLDELQDLVEENELDRRITEYNYKTSLLCEQKITDLEVLKGQLAQEHSLKVKEHERKQIQMAKERQTVFEQVFESELEQYKKSGIVPKPTSSLSRSTTLDEIVVEQDREALDEFLND